MIRVVGTAGHVDHGKSALVEALTGTHPDRLREERLREMTIDLGFAWTHLPGEIEVGFIDVPGHRDFIDNMLAGAGGFDAALLVVAADEGVMPQTREHLAILDLLQIPQVVVALTKIDLVEDPGWAGLVEEDVRRELAGTSLPAPRIVRVSARSGAGLDELRHHLAELLRQTQPPRDLGQPRLPIDRSFVMTGFGTVLTGTLLDGGLASGDAVEILPSGLRGRIRGLQTHGRPVDVAAPGSRVAVNVSGIDAQQVSRGDVLSAPGLLRPTKRIDAEVRVIADAPVAIRDGQQLKLHVGSADVVARARILGSDRIEPGTTGWVQLVLQAPIAVKEGDRFILRRPTPGATLGGGQVVDAHPQRLHRRRDPRVIESLAARRHGSSADRIVAFLAGQGLRSAEEVRQEIDAGEATPESAFDEAVADGRLFRFDGEADAPQLFVESALWSRLTERALAALEQYHSTFPLRPGMPKEELRSRLGLDPRGLDRALAGLGHEGKVVAEGARVSRAGFGPSPSPEDIRRAEALQARFAAAPFAPPSIREARQAVGDELWSLLVFRGEYVEVSEDVVFDRGSYARLVSEIADGLAGGGTVTVAGLRDRYHTSRKYALALLEHLDRVGVTVRAGDERRLKPGWRGPQNEGPPSG